jgi:ABC-type lipoprotein release transport system permease subunit
LSSLLYGVGETDPATFLAVCLLLALVAATATYLPARRAARVDPVRALSST